MLVKGMTEVGTIAGTVSLGSGGHGSYSWAISSTASATGSDYKVSVQSISQPSVKDTSNSYLTLTPAGTTIPSITVTAPNGGDSWQRGTSHTVTWDYTGSPGPAVKIMLVKGTTEVGTITASTSSGTGGKGSYSWPISSSGSTGSDYKVSVQSISQPAIKDTSNSYFTLAKAITNTPVPTPTPLSISTITVTSPNGKESGNAALLIRSPGITGQSGAKIKAKLCKACERCLPRCPEGAISILPRRPAGGKPEGVAFIDAEKCIGCGECIVTCRSGAVLVQWNESIPVFQKKMVEHAFGATRNKEGKSLFLNFLTQVSPACDCCGYSDAPIVHDIGILASEDPVAIDQASVDLVNDREGNRSSKLPGAWNRGEDKFRALYPEVDWSIQLRYGEEIGLGRREYELIQV